MKGYPLDGNPTVTRMASLEISGNVIPLEWFNHIKMPNGKPDAVAILLLSDIVYWYRPIEERDERTGKVIGYRKKFASDKLQRGYDGFASLYGFTKDQVRDALRRLEEKGVIDLELRHPIIGGQKLGNVLFIGLNADRLQEITHPLSDLNPRGYQEIIPDPMGKESDTNTEITPEISSKESSSLSNLPAPTPFEEFCTAILKKYPILQTTATAVEVDGLEDNWRTFGEPIIADVIRWLKEDSDVGLKSLAQVNKTIRENGAGWVIGSRRKEKKTAIQEHIEKTERKCPHVDDFLIRLAANFQYGQRDIPTLVSNFRNRLKDYSPEALEIACGELLDTCKFFPTIKDARESCERAEAQLDIDGLTGPEVGDDNDKPPVEHAEPPAPQPKPEPDYWQRLVELIFQGKPPRDRIGRAVEGARYAGITPDGTMEVIAACDEDRLLLEGRVLPYARQYTHLLDGGSIARVAFVGEEGWTGC